MLIPSIIHNAKSTHLMYPSSRGMMTQPPCCELMTDLKARASLASVKFMSVERDLPEDPGVRVIRLKDAVHDAPVYVGADAIKRDA